MFIPANHVFIIINFMNIPSNSKSSCLKQIINSSTYSEKFFFNLKVYLKYYTQLNILFSVSLNHNLLCHSVVLHFEKPPRDTLLLYFNILHLMPSPPLLKLKYNIQVIFLIILFCFPILFLCRGKNKAYFLTLIHFYRFKPKNCIKINNL